MVTVEEYQQKMAQHLLKEAKTPGDFRNLWIDPQKRKTLIGLLPDDGQGLRLLRELMNRQNYDLYDVLAEIGYGIAPKDRAERVLALQYKHGDWFKTLPSQTADTLMALAHQFEKGGTEGIENPYVFNAPEIVKAGGIETLKILGEPKDIINEAKERLFAV